MALTPDALGTQRTRIRALIQEPTTSYFTNADLNSYINEAQFAIATGVIPGMATGQSGPILATEAFTASVTDQELYSLPPVYHAMRTVRVRSVSTEDFSELPSTDIEYARAHPRASVPKPTNYFLWGEGGTYQLGMYPAFNSANGRIYVTYWQRPDELTTDSSVLQIPPELHVANTYLAAHRAELERGHGQSAANLLQLFQSEYQGSLAYINQRQLNKDRAVMVGHIGDDDTERILQ